MQPGLAWQASKYLILTKGSSASQTLRYPLLSLQESQFQNLQEGKVGYAEENLITFLVSSMFVAKIVRMILLFKLKKPYITDVTAIL